MNETRGNSRTKQVKNPIFPDNFTEGEPLKERENHSLKDSEKTTGYYSKVKVIDENEKCPILLDIKLTFSNAVDSKNYHFIEHIDPDNQESFYKSLTIILNRWCK